LYKDKKQQTKKRAAMATQNEVSIATAFVLVLLPNLLNTSKSSIKRSTIKAIK
jgi:hypothetical protein